MRKTLRVLALCLLLPAVAQAATLSIGGRSISYTVPRGYMPGDEEPYRDIRGFLTEIFPDVMRVLAFYVDEESHRKFMNPQGRRLEHYFIVSTLRPLENKNLSARDFMEVKKGVVNAQAQLKTTLRQKVNRELGKAGDGGMSIAAVDALGVYDVSDTGFSFMAVMDQVRHAGGQRETAKQAMVSSYLLARGKLVIVNQYRLLDPAGNMADQLGEVRESARRILHELNIRQGASWAFLPDSFLLRVLAGALAGGFMGGLTGWLVRRARKKAAA